MLAAATLIAAVLSRKGVVVSTEDVLSMLTTAATIIVPLAIMLRQWATGRSTAFGMRPKVATIR